MKLKSMIPVLALSFAVAGLSAAEAKPKKQHRDHQRPAAASVSVGAGTASAGRRGAQSGAVVAGGAMTSRTGCAVPSTTATYSTGATYADRGTASAAGSTGGSAAGAGTVRSSSDLDVTATRDTEWGTDATVSGGSDAVARESTRRQRC